jgi:hypothetical protein
MTQIAGCFENEAASGRPENWPPELPSASPNRLSPKGLGGRSFGFPEQPRGLPAARRRQFAAGIAQALVDGMNRKPEGPRHGFGVMAGQEQAKRMLLLLGQRLITLFHRSLASCRLS